MIYGADSYVSGSQGCCVHSLSRLADAVWRSPADLRPEGSPGSPVDSSTADAGISGNSPPVQGIRATYRRVDGHSTLTDDRGDVRKPLPDGRLCCFGADSLVRQSSLQSQVRAPPYEVKAGFGQDSVSEELVIDKLLVCHPLIPYSFRDSVFPLLLW